VAQDNLHQCSGDDAGTVTSADTSQDDLSKAGGSFVRNSNDRRIRTHRQPGFQRSNPFGNDDGCTRRQALRDVLIDGGLRHYARYLRPMNVHSIRGWICVTEIHRIASPVCNSRRQFGLIPPGLKAQQSIEIVFHVVSPRGEPCLCAPEKGR
jgi:hypothetical protein